jgi:hypothetical protein
MTILAKKKNRRKNDLDKLILETVENSKPSTVQKLVGLVKERNELPEQRIMEHVLNLQSEGKLTFKENPTELSETAGSFLFSNHALWYWITTILVIVSAASVFTIPEDAFPIVYARYILGSLFVLFFPGYSFIKALFPKEVPFKTRSEELDNIERIALSIGMSLALVPITGLLLNYTPWGIRTTPITLSLLALTVGFATAAIIREYQTGTATTNK